MCVNMVPSMAPAQSMPAAALGKVALPVLDCTPLFSGAPLDEASAMRLATILKVPGEPARLRLLSLIRASRATRRVSAISPMRSICRSQR
jgi:hypothetical protein